MEDKTGMSNPGAVVSVRGSVVDIRFDQHLPAIYSVLRTGDEGRIVTGTVGFHPIVGDPFFWNGHS